MSRFSQAFVTAAPTGAQPLIEIIAGASDHARLVEFGLSIDTLASLSVGLGFPAAKGITPTAPVAFLSEDTGDTSTTGLTSAQAWVTAPTLPAYFYRRGKLGIQSDRLVWTWPRGLLLLPSVSIVLWAFAAGPALEGWAVFED